MNLHEYQGKEILNSFGGIVRGDRVAQGVVDASKSMGDVLNVPVIVRLQGTNAVEGDDSGLKVHSAIQFEDVAKLVNEVLN